MTHRPAVVAFDVIETLMSLEPLRARLTEIGQPPDLLEAWDTRPRWLALVAAHDWDCHGAKRAGLITGWVSRKSGGFGAPFEPPDVVGEDLTEVAAKLLALNS